jgi:uncharacterized protein (TIGR03067 family)
MNRRLMTLLVSGTLIAAGLGTAARADDPLDQAVARDRALIEGTWRVVSLVINGDEAKKEDARKLLVVNGADGSWKLVVDGKEIARGTSQIDPAKLPKALDFTPTEGDAKGKLFLGIYELGEKKRTMCFAPTGKERPHEFSSAMGSGHILLTFERETD